MADPDVLLEQLRELGRDLDQRGATVDADALMARAAATPPARRTAVVTAAGAAAVGFVAVVAVLLWPSDHDGAVSTVDEAPITTSPQTTLSRTSTSAPGATSDYDGTPVDQLPAAGVAMVSVREGTAVLVGYDGAELATATAPIGDLTAPNERRMLAVRLGSTLDAMAADLALAPDGCDRAAGAGGVRVALCGGEAQLREHIERITPTGQSIVLIGPAPGSQGVGHWRWAIPSPDGNSVLAEWSGECEVPTTFLVAADGSGAIRTIDGRPGAGESIEARAIGWAPDGRAVVDFGKGSCGAGLDPSGVYLVDPVTLERTLLHRRDEPTEEVFLWELRAYGNDPEWVYTKALRELGLSGCCGEPSHGGPAATAGAVWEGIEIPVSGAPTDRFRSVWFNDTVLDSEPITLDAAAATFGHADLGPFVAYTCGPWTWTFGGAGAGERASDDAVERLAAAFLPRLYCTVGDPPDAPGHGAR